LLDDQLSLFPHAGNETGAKTAKRLKTKLLFRLPHEKMLYMAGMVNTFRDKDGKAEDAFVILTTSANTAMMPFHDRMPVILSGRECEDWITSEAFMHEVLARECPTLEWSKAS
jgi:putative SOS response-associated peptidase YedK